MFPLRDTVRTNKFAFITNAIIAVNVFVFFLEMTAVDPEAFIETYALIPANVDFSNFSSLTPFISSQFLHAGFVHILSNMWFLHIFGDNVEERFGSILYLFIYLLSGTIGAVFQYLFNTDVTIPMLGASGAVAGILGAYFVYFPHHKVETLVPIGFFVSTINVSAGFILFYWFITQLFSGVGSIAVAQIGGVAFWAHVGGFVTGWIIAKLFQNRGKRIFNYFYPLISLLFFKKSINFFSEVNWRPIETKSLLIPLQYFLGTILTNSFSVASGVFVFTHPNKFEILWTCVSTAIAGFPNARFRTKLAVFLPTPGSFKSSPGILGISPSYL